MKPIKQWFYFLDHYWRLGGKNSDELAGLLGSLAILADGSSADPALMEEGV